MLLPVTFLCGAAAQTCTFNITQLPILVQSFYGVIQLRVLASNCPDCTNPELWEHDKVDRKRKIARSKTLQIGYREYYLSY